VWVLSREQGNSTLLYCALLSNSSTLTALLLYLLLYPLLPFLNQKPLGINTLLKGLILLQINILVSILMLKVGIKSIIYIYKLDFAIQFSLLFFIYF
jgi:hypothetical protein